MLNAQKMRLSKLWNHFSRPWWLYIESSPNLNRAETRRKSAMEGTLPRTHLFPFRAPATDSRAADFSALGPDMTSAADIYASIVVEVMTLEGSLSQRPRRRPKNLAMFASPCTGIVIEGLRCRVGEDAVQRWKKKKIKKSLLFVLCLLGKVSIDKLSSKPDSYVHKHYKSKLKDLSFLMRTFHVRNFVPGIEYFYNITQLIVS